MCQEGWWEISLHIHHPVPLFIGYFCEKKEVGRGRRGGSGGERDRIGILGITGVVKGLICTKGPSPQAIAHPFCLRIEAAKHITMISSYQTITIIWERGGGVIGKLTHLLLRYDRLQVEDALHHLVDIQIEIRYYQIHRGEDNQNCAAYRSASTCAYFYPSLLASLLRCLPWSYYPPT